jgi:transcription antitermination factor NusG
MDREWLQGANISSPPHGTWVRIVDRGLYYNDLALVVSPRQGDLVTLAVVPRFSQNERKRRRKGTRLGPARLDAESLARLPFKENFYRSGLRKFHPNGLEFLLAPAAHALKPESNPSEEQLRPFEQSISLQRSEKSHDIDWLLLDAVKSAYQQIVRDTWRAGDKIRIRVGKFISWRGRLNEIYPSQSALVSVLDPNSLDTTHVEIILASLERYFEIGDVVRVVIGMEKGRKGSITSIEDEVATIVELSSEPREFFVEVSILTSFLGKSFNYLFSV